MSETDILEQLHRLESKLTDVQITTAELRAILPPLCQRISRIEQELWGNGRTGLSVKVNAILYIASAIGAIVTALAGANVVSILGL